MSLSLDTIESMNGEQMSGLYLEHAQNDLNLRILRMFEGTFSLDMAQIIYAMQKPIKWSGISFLTYFAHCVFTSPSCVTSSVSSARKYHRVPLWEQAYSNILKILPPKRWKFSDKNSDVFPISAQNIDCGYPLEPPRRGGSNEYPQSIFFSRNRKNNV